MKILTSIMKRLEKLFCARNIKINNSPYLRYIAPDNSAGKSTANLCWMAQSLLDSSMFILGYHSFDV